MPHPPQLNSSLEVTTHAPSQLVCPGGHVAVQAPFTQVCAFGHSAAQAPQLVTLFCKSTQLRPHAVRPAWQLVVQAPLTQTSAGGQRVPQAPQLFESDASSVQLPSQLAEPGHAWVQLPSAHALPLAHTVPMAPQSLELLRKLTHEVEGPAFPKEGAGTRLDGHELEQLPFAQISPLGQAAPQAPQLSALVSTLTQRPPHSTCPEGHALVQVPPTQT